VLELEGALAEASPVAVAGTSGELVARDALVELGFSLVEAEQALAQVDPELPAEERVREALRSAA
jgi:Holliday junction resolvasome RuvABC DNA-binding subunit